MANHPPSAPPDELSSSAPAAEPFIQPFERSGEGQAPSFPEVHERLSERVDRWIRLSGVEKRNRPDVAQEAWARIDRALPSYAPDRPIEPWACTIVRHAACDHARRGYVQREVPFPAIRLQASVDPELSMQRRLDGEALLRRAHATMPDEAWQVFVLVEVEGVSCTEIAEELGMPLGTINSRLFRAHAHIAATLERMDAADVRRTGMLGPWAAFVVPWRHWWSRLRAWLDRRVLVGAITGGAIVYWLLQPAAPGSAPVALAPAERPVPSGTASASADVNEPALTAAVPASSKENVAAARVPAAAASSSSTAPGPAAGTGRNAVSPASRDRERAEDWSALAALEAAHVLLQNGDCDEAGKRLARHAARLAAGPFAQEYQALQRKVRACPR
jgi:RNA polymerase sigma-70 factor (ECF subfamily)